MSICRIIIFFLVQTCFWGSGQAAALSNTDTDYCIVRLKIEWSDLLAEERSTLLKDMIVAFITVQNTAPMDWPFIMGGTDNEGNYRLLSRGTCDAATAKTQPFIDSAYGATSSIELQDFLSDNVSIDRKACPFVHKKGDGVNLDAVSFPDCTQSGQNKSQ